MNIVEYKKDVVYNKLKENILNKKYKAREKLPKETIFAKQLGVGQVTLRSALKRLEDEKLVLRMPSKGTFVCNLDDLKDDLASDTGIIIVIPSNPSSQSTGQYIVSGIIEEASACSLNAFQIETEYLEAIEEDKIDQITQNNNILGIIALVNSFNGNEKLLHVLQKMHKPVVLPHASRNDGAVTGFATISSLQKQAWFDSLEYLCQQGHERIASLVLHSNNKSFRNTSEEDHFKFLEENGASINKKLLAKVSYIYEYGKVSYDYRDVEKAMNELMNLPKPPTAIMCFSDFLAIHVYKFCKEHNIKIPEQLAVMGYCGYPGSKFLSPPLSTIDFQYLNIGKTAVKLLKNSNQWFGASEKVAVPQIFSEHVLIKRESTNIKKIEKYIS